MRPRLKWRVRRGRGGVGRGGRTVQGLGGRSLRQQGYRGRQVGARSGGSVLDTNAMAEMQGEEGAQGTGQGEVEWCKVRGEGEMGAQGRG